MQSIRIIRIMQCRREFRGTTLIELIAASTAVAVIAGVTLVSLGGMRTASQRDVCLNNLRRIAAASADYAADDPRNNAIPIHPRYGPLGNTVIGDYQFGGKSGNVSQPQNYIYTVEGGFGSLARPLNPRLYDMATLVAPECRDPFSLTQECVDADKALAMEVFHCPTDTGRTGLHYSHWAGSGRTAYDYFGTSYQANQMMICTGGNGDMKSISPFQRPIDEVPNPARTILYMETNGRFAWAWGYGPWGFGTEFTVGGWHGEDWQFNAAFVDGHAKTITMRGSADGGEVNGPDDAEYTPGLPSADVAWWQVTTRGPEWQLDTLPAPPVPTGKRCGGGVSADAPAAPSTMRLYSDPID